MKKTVLLFMLISSLSFAQKKFFTHQDTLRGSITKERIWWDLQHYKLELSVYPKIKFINGKNTIRYKVLEPYQTLQIDLQNPLKITKITQNNIPLDFKKDGYSYFIKLKNKQYKDKIYEIIVFYEGNPLVSKNPPWSGGFTWKKDKNNNDFIATTCQGIGASIWWPNKDHMYDEPDNGMDIIVTTPKHLMAISNGRLIKTIRNKNETATYFWKVINPINNYGVNITVGKYIHFSEIFKGEKGNLDCNYYVPAYNLEKAKKQFKQVKKMLLAFEYWFGAYPFYEDSYKLVEVPYLGMEHQSSVTYGNHYKNGYLGRDLSGTGWGLKFDFIIIHESGHEWFANNITYKDIADMWIHESFTAYSETLYLNYHFGKNAGNQYVIGTRKRIRNTSPIIGIYNVNKSGSGDMYYKGANMIHTYRQLVNDDKKFRQILRGMSQKFYHQTVTTQQIENYMSEQLGQSLIGFFNQYLRSIKIPKLEYRISKNTIFYRFTNIVDGFNIPIKVFIDKKIQWIRPSKEWKNLKIENKISSFSMDKNFYIQIKKVK